MRAAACPARRRSSRFAVVAMVRVPVGSVLFTVATKAALPALALAARLPMAKRNTPEPGAVSVQPALLAPALKVVFAGNVSVRNAPVAF